LAQVAEVLTSNPSTAKKKKERVTSCSLLTSLGNLAAGEFSKY
jgi:hypothetical protein